MPSFTHHPAPAKITAIVESFDDQIRQAIRVDSVRSTMRLIGLEMVSGDFLY